MSKTQRLFTFIFLIAVCSSASAQVVSYGASLHESQWGSTASRMQCTLVHEIPRYGKALFMQNAGEGLIFSLRPKTQLPPVKDIQLVSVAPAWKHDRKDEVLWNIPTTKERRRIDLNGEYALRVFTEVSQGMSPTFNYLDPIDGHVKILTSISPVWLGPALAKFTTCVANLLPHNFQQIRQSKLHFDFGSSILLPDTEDRADELAEFIQANKNIRKIKIDGHTDNVGTYYFNRSLGQHRAEAFKARLVEKGVPEDKIVLRTYGERKPEATNKTSEGRALNRRVLVTLEQ